MATVPTLADSTTVETAIQTDIKDFLTAINNEVAALEAGDVAWTYVDKTASYTVVASTDTYGTKIFTNNGAAGAITFSLPAGANAMRVGFNVVDAQTLKVSANGSETIRHKATQTAGGGYLQSATVGDFLILEWNGDEWIVTELEGHNWTDGTATLNIATATLRGEVELATDAETQTGTDTARAITPANLQACTAITTRKGVVELATTAECQTGTDTERAVTPAGAKASAQTFAKYTGVWNMDTSRDAGDTTNDINITAGRCWSDDLANEIVLATEITKRIDATWAVGDDQGGLDTGSVANSTWYYLFGIYNPTSSVSDILISASLSSPTMPSGYTKKRLIGFVYRSAGGVNTAFAHIGNWWWWDAPAEDFDDAAIGSTASQKVMAVPLGLRVKARFRANALHASGRYYVNFYPGDGSEQITDAFANSGSNLTGATGDTDSGLFEVITDTSGQIKVDGDQASTRVATYTLGWEYQR